MYAVGRVCTAPTNDLLPISYCSVVAEDRRSPFNAKGYTISAYIFIPGLAIALPH